MDQHRLPHRTPRAEGSPYRLRHSSDAAATRRRASDMSPDMMTATTVLFSGKTNEKEMLHGLNDRFAGFIEKVRHLERQNHLLESEIKEIKERRARSPSLEEEYGAELEELRKLLRDIAQQKLQIELEHQNLEEEMAHLRAKYEKEAHHKSDAESGIAMLKRDIGDAYQAKVQLDKKAQGLVDEMDLLKKSHEAEVSRMLAQVEEAQQVSVGAAAARVDFGKADLTAALRDIRAQLEGHAASDLRQADETFRSQFAKLTEAAESRREALKASQREVQECRRHLQAKSIELDCNTGTRDALERQLREVEDRHGEDILHYQDTIKELENELISAKFDMSAHLREYQDLLNVKMELDVEILSYRKLLEGEETRLSTISGTPVSMPYIYRQSPVYTLPCLRPSPGRRAEPQYKFVEEIITETTREIEMSEFEESGSDEAVDGGAEEGCDKAERESGEEEEAEDNQSDRYAPDRDGEPASDSQQNLVESAERPEQGDDDKVEKETPVEGEGSEAVDKAMGESRDSEAAESTENDDRPAAESAHSEEAPGVPENEPCDSVANVNGQNASDAPMPPTVQKDVAAKAEDSKIEESEEVKKTESEVDKKVSALKKSEESDVKDDIDAAQAMVLKDESSAKGPTDSGDVQESSVVGKPQVEAPSLPAETTEKTTDLTVALSVPLAEDTVQPEKQNKETPSVVPRGEEKEDRITESMALGRADTVKSDIGHEVPKSIENTTDDADKAKDSVSPSVKSEPPKLEVEKPNTGDKAQTVDTTFTKEKIAVTAEAKDAQQGAADGSKTQEPANAVDDTDLEKVKHTAAKSDKTEPPKLDGKKSISEDKTQTVEPIFPMEKIAVTVENKDSQPESSTTQEPSNAIDDKDVEKDKRTVAESDMTEPPKLEDTKPNTGDKTQTVDATIPKEKIAVTAETKGPQQGAPDSGKTLKPSNAKLEDEKSDSGDKTQTVEPIFPKEKIAVTEESKDSQKGVPDSSKTQPLNTDLEKVKSKAAESDMTEPPKPAGEKSISADKTPTVEPIVPKEKIATTVENKDSQPDSRATQEPSNTDLEKVKLTAAKSDMTEPPKLDGEKSISADKIPTVEPILPKEKIAVTVDNKDSKQDVTESSKTQEPSNADLEKVKRTAAKSDMKEPPKLKGEKSISEDKTQTVEPIFPKEKIAVTVENKDSQPESSTTQVPSNAIDDKDVEKDKRTAAESDMTEPPKLDSERSISTAPTVEPIVPKEKIAVTVENKDSQPDGSTTQEPSKADLEKVKRTAAESDVTEPPKLDSEKSVSVDITPTVETILPKEKITVTVESKDPKQDVTESSKTQDDATDDSDLEKVKRTAVKSESPKLEGEKSISEDKTQTVEPIVPKEKIAVTVENKDSQPDSRTTQESSKADLEKVKSTAAESDVTEPPKLDSEKSVSGDITPTVETILPKEKITVTVESKDPKQDVTESSKTQKPSGATDDSDLEKVKHTAAESDMTEPPKLDSEKSVSVDKTPTVEPKLPKEKITVTVESKDSKQDVTESSTTQESSKADLEKVKSTAAKSDMTESPKMEGEKSVSGDKTPTVEPILPKEKITVTVESKDPKQDVTESSKTQEPSSGATDDSDLEKVKRTAVKSESPKLEGEKSISEDKTQTVEPIFPKEKIAVTVENKDAKQPDGGKSPEPPKVPEKINNAKEKEETLKDYAKTKDSGKTTENETEPIEICETKTPSPKEPGVSTVSVTAKTVDGLMSEAAKPETENGFSNGIGGIKAKDNEPMKVVPPQGEASKEKTHTSI